MYEIAGGESGAFKMCKVFDFCLISEKILLIWVIQRVLFKKKLPYKKKKE